MASEHTRNSKALEGFSRYCREHPHERFWQALRNWSGYHFVLVADIENFENFEPANVRDTFNWEGIDGK
jgi:hypothetical protein